MYSNIITNRVNSRWYFCILDKTTRYRYTVEGPFWRYNEFLVYFNTFAMVEDKDRTVELTDHEAELYDRQIRLWGLESQKRLRAAKVLLIGLNGFGAEIAKNIILAGVKAVTLLDHRNITDEDKCSQFFVAHSDIGKNRAEASLRRAQDLNSMVIVETDTDNVDDKPDDYFAKFDVVCATECTITQLKSINAACRKHNVKFFAGDVWGTFGYTFADLISHEYVEDVVQTKKVELTDDVPLQKEKFESITVTEKHTDTFVPFEYVLNVKKSSLPRESEIYYMMLIMLNYREKYGKDPLPSERYSKNFQTEAEAVIKKYDLDGKIDRLVQGDIYAQVSPVCAIVGGVMGQEIIKTVSQKGVPHNNLFIFNPETLCGKILRLGK